MGRGETSGKGVRCEMRLRDLWGAPRTWTDPGCLEGFSIVEKACMAIGKRSREAAERSRLCTLEVRFCVNANM